jgi:hypothetical protein
MQPRSAKISGNLTLFSTVKVRGYNTGGPYMLKCSTFTDAVRLFIIIREYY